ESIFNHFHPSTFWFWLDFPYFVDGMLHIAEYCRSSQEQRTDTDNQRPGVIFSELNIFYDVLYLGRCIGTYQPVDFLTYFSFRGFLSEKKCGQRYRKHQQRSQRKYGVIGQGGAELESFCIHKDGEGTFKHGYAAFNKACCSHKRKCFSL